MHVLYRCCSIPRPGHPAHGRSHQIAEDVRTHESKLALLSRATALRQADACAADR
jgi:hypothetical protein